MTDDLKRNTPISAFKPPGVGAYRGQEKPTVTVEAAPAWAIKMQEGINANHTLVVTEIQRMKADIDGLKTWRDTGKHSPVILPDGPKPTISGEVRRVSENDLKQDSIIATIKTEVAEIKSEVVGLKDSQAKQSNNISVIKDTQAEVKSAVTGFFRQHPELTTSIATLLGVIIALATAWLQAKVHP